MSLVRIAFLIPALLLASCSYQASQSSWPSTLSNHQKMANKLPVVIVDEPVRILHFENIRNEGGTLKAEVSGATDRLEAHDLVADQYDEAGNKLDVSGVHFPPLEPGKSGQLWLILQSDAAKVVIRRRTWND